ncbi:hypothetical protein HS088_TW19G00359 [Tripterygium wilfordii]|uniref:Uncharacterized protein n=1 Tax=Tripterygium wilfordii TaxID=458696 RepID=A0A7J7C9F0_TRIWF|nr:hypothetical protein HS088_TW19G00359 [Tripterygium wilfordii]
MGGDDYYVNPDFGDFTDEDIFDDEKSSDDEEMEYPEYLGKKRPLLWYNVEVTTVGMPPTYLCHHQP